MPSASKQIKQDFKQKYNIELQDEDVKAYGHLMSKGVAGSVIGILFGVAIVLMVVIGVLTNQFPFDIYVIVPFILGVCVIVSGGNSITKKQNEKEALFLRQMQEKYSPVNQLPPTNASFMQGNYNPANQLPPTNASFMQGNYNPANQLPPTNVSFTQEKDLLEKFGKVIKMSQRVKKADVAQYFNIPPQILFAKLVDWSEFLPFQISEELISVPDLNKFEDALNQRLHAMNDFIKSIQ